MKPAPALLLLAALALPQPGATYPVDGYPHTGIRRLDHVLAVERGEVRGRPLRGGQSLRLDEIALAVPGGDAALPAADPALDRRLRELIPADQRARYGVVLLDLSDPAAPRYAAHRPRQRANAGSVGKLVVALAVFQALADAHPGDVAARERVLREAQVVADGFSQPDHHGVVFWDPATRQRRVRPLRPGDAGSLWEFLDWMLSASSNAAAAMVQKELIALRHFGAAYPPPRAQYDAFFAGTPPRALGRLLEDAMTSAVARNGLDPAQLRQGSLFTAGGNRRAPMRGGSYATPEQLVRLLFRLEAGALVDPFSSRELKRLLYMTQRRIRYASHPVLDEAAVYFKSGSFYQCQAGSACGRYRGDRANHLASVAIVESPARQPRHRYLVAVMSNVLGVNSAVAHQALALRLHRLVESLHPGAAAQPAPEPAWPAVPVDDPDPGEPAGGQP